MSEYADDIATYVSPVNEEAVTAIVKYCGIAPVSYTHQTLPTNREV